MTTRSSKSITERRVSNAADERVVIKSDDCCDHEVNIDAIGFRPDGKSAAVRIPAAYGHLGEDLHTWTGGFGNVTYWNAYVANLQMHGNGNFNDERFNDPTKYPAAVRGGFFKLRHNPDQVTPK